MVNNNGTPVPLAGLLQLAAFLFRSCICLKTTEQAFENIMIIHLCKCPSPDLQCISNSSDIGIVASALNNTIVQLCRGDNLQARFCTG